MTFDCCGLIFSHERQMMMDEILHVVGVKKIMYINVLNSRHI